MLEYLQAKAKLLLEMADEIPILLGTLPNLVSRHQHDQVCGCKL
jgi:hypothetical protein